MNTTSIDIQNKLPARDTLLWIWRVSLVLMLILLLILAWLVAFGNLYRSDSKLGYNLGLTGGLMMLSLLLYPLRKRIRGLERLGRMESWFRYHMFFGIGGPILILFHSTFRTGAVNSTIALYAMLMVALSGVIGRFVYRHIHRGLYGSEMTNAELDTEFRERQKKISLLFALQPEIKQGLETFHQLAFANLDNIPQRLWRFMTLRYRGKRLSNRVRLNAKMVLETEARKHNWSHAQQSLNYKLVKQQIDDYIYSIIRLTQLSSWTKLTSLWNFVHVPFVYLLFISGIIHVIAVHLY